MSRFRSLTERLADQARAREKLAQRVHQVVGRSGDTKKRKSKPKMAAEKPAIDATAPQVPSRPDRPWARVRAGTAPIQYQARSSGDSLAPQPWARELIDKLLVEADQGGISLCLVWPAKLVSLPLVHAMANIERVFVKDLRGLRTLLYPGTHACRAPLNGVLAHRQALDELYCGLWVEKERGLHEAVTHTSSDAFLAVLSVLNGINQHDHDLSSPALAELVPAFVFDDPKRGWETIVPRALQRTLAKIKSQAFRRELRERVSSEWGDPSNAPGSLMVMHHSTKQETWKAALADKALLGPGAPEVLLLDATDAAVSTNHKAVEKIPDFLLFAKKNGLAGCGALIITDDPKRFFILRAKLAELKLSFSTNVWAAEADDALLSTNPVSLDWKPSLRSNSNFSVGIVDRDASQVALAFQRLASNAGNEGSPAHVALIEACKYVLRLSNMPAGYADLTEASSESGFESYASRQNSWTPRKLALMEALQSGALNENRQAVETAIKRAEQLIDDWSDATPMAARLLAEVRKHAVTGHHGIVLVLPSNKYMQLAHRFLQRKLADEWASAAARIQWHSLSSVAKTMSIEGKNKQHFAFVGINADVLRILITHPDVPNGTSVLMPYRRAESTLKTLMSMKDVEAFKAYRGRIGLMAIEIERRLAEVPNPILIGKLHEISMHFSFEDSGSNGQGGETEYYKFHLEGGGRAYSSGWMYRYVPDEDPPFRRAAAATIRPGDFVFEMSDRLRSRLETSLHLSPEGGASSIVSPVRTLLKLYHEDVQRRCAILFKAKKRSALAREIHAKMVEIDPSAEKCRQGRVYYWLALQAEGDTRPHAARDSRYFKVFCRALDMSDEAAEQNWNFVRNARRLNQSLGRELVARYSEILFQPESALTYRKVPEGVIKQLQQEALHCVYRVECVEPPKDRTP